MEYSGYEDGYEVGFDNGYQQGIKVGYEQGANDIAFAYEQKIALFQAEMVSLNARLDRLETVMKGESHGS